MSANRQGQTKRKAPRTAFKPGQSGNPSGRPKAIIEVVNLAQQQTVVAIRGLTNIATRGKTEAAIVAACVALLDRGWGKPTQRQEIAISADLAAAVERLRGLREGTLIEGARHMLTIDADATDG